MVTEAIIDALLVSMYVGGVVSCFHGLAENDVDGKKSNGQLIVASLMWPFLFVWRAVYVSTRDYH